MEEAKVIDINSGPATDKGNEAKETDPLHYAKQYLDYEFDFRINEINQRVIFRRKYEKDFHTLDDFQRNSIYLELKKNGKKINFDDFKRMLFSNLIPFINPLQEFIIDQSKNIIPGTDYISHIAQTVTVENSGHWEQYFKKWFVAMIANVFEPFKNTNHECLVLAGEQGAYKTTWLSALVPTELVDYCYMGQIKPDNKDTLKQLALRLLIIIDDQLDKLNKSNQDDLKFLITLPRVSWRPLFREYDYDGPRLASFCGSVNGMQFLTDLTGSRRFLSFYVSNIDIDGLKKIDLNKAYGQAYGLYLSGFQYWFDQEDIKKISEENEQFTIVTVEQELIEKYFDISKQNDETWTSTDIKTKLEFYSGKERLSIKKIGEVLHKLKAKRGNYEYNGKRRLSYRITFIPPDIPTT